MTEIEKLKPCPFCGGEASFQPRKFAIICNACGARRPDGSPDSADHVASWNARASDAALLVAEKALHSGISFAEEWIYEHGGIEGCDYSDLRAFQSMKSALSEISKLTGGGE